MNCELCGKEKTDVNRFHTVCEECLKKYEEERAQMLEDFRRHVEED